MQLGPLETLGWVYGRVGFAAVGREGTAPDAPTRGTYPGIGGRRHLRRLGWRCVRFAPRARGKMPISRTHKIECEGLPVVALTTAIRHGSAGWRLPLANHRLGGAVVPGRPLYAEMQPSKQYSIQLLLGCKYISTSRSSGGIWGTYTGRCPFSPKKSLV